MKNNKIKRYGMSYTRINYFLKEIKNKNIVIIDSKKDIENMNIINNGGNN